MISGQYLPIEIVKIKPCEIACKSSIKSPLSNKLPVSNIRPLSQGKKVNQPPPPPLSFMSFSPAPYYSTLINDRLHCSISTVKLRVD